MNRNFPILKWQTKVQPIIARLIILKICLCYSFVSLAGEPLGTQASLADRYARATESFQKQIHAFAKQCLIDQETTLADRIKRFFPERTTASLFYFLPSDDYLTPSQTENEKLFIELRRKHAQVLMQLAQEAATAGQVGLAIPLLYEALYFDGNLIEAREILGQKKIEGRWVSEHAAERLTRGLVWDDQFGWISKDHLERYQEDERFFRGRWISSREDARRHQEIRNGWKVETDHYEITTNVSIEAGVDLAQKLEAFYSVWSQLFAGYYLSKKSAVKQFSRTHIQAKDKKKHKIYYFRNRSDYDQSLAKIQPGIAGKTLGVYLENIKTAYFFAPNAESDEEKELSQITIWHEATHQLFAERIPTRKVSGLKNNFWFVEGIACFLETLQREDQGWRLGGVRAGRLPTARIRVERDHFYIPFAEVVGYGANEMLRNPQYRTLSTQAAGQAAFLMTAKNGIFRPAAIEYLRAIYRGRGKRDTLSNLTTKSFTALDQEYRDFLLGISGESTVE